jgi:hypothetical protein
LKHFLKFDSNRTLSFSIFDIMNHSTSSASNTSNVTGPQAINSPANPPIAFSTQPNPSTSGVGTHAMNEQLANVNDPAENITPVDSDMDSGHRAKDSITNNQDLTPPSATITLEYTDDSTVRRLHDAFHTDLPQRSGVPFTLASSRAPRTTFRDRRELGLEPSPTALKFRGGSVLEYGEAPDGQPNPTSDDSNTIDGVYASVDSETGCNHGQAECSNTGVVRNGYGRAQASPNTPLDDVSSINVSDLRVGPVSREPLNELAIFSEYPEDEPTRIAPEEGTAASSQTNSTTSARRLGLVPLLRNDNTNHGDGQALVSPNSPAQPQAADALPPSDLASHRPRRWTSSIDLGHGSPSDSYTRDSTPRDEGCATRLSDYLSEVPLSAEEVEAWNRASTAAPVNGNTRLHSPHNSSDYDENQDRILPAINRSAEDGNRRVLRVAGSLRQMNTEENRAFWHKFDGSRDE